MTERLILSAQEADTDATMLTDTSKVSNPNQLPLFAIAGYPAPSKEMPLNAKSLLCEVSTPKQKLLETSEAVLTSKEKGPKPYWTGLCKVISSRLLLPIGLVSPGSVSTLYDTSLNKTVANSWFLTKQNTARKKSSRRIFSPSCMSSVADCMGSEVPVIKSKRIRVYPSSEQRETLRQWIGTARWTYNKTVALLNDTDTQANWIAIKTGILDDLPDWAKPVPYQIKSVAIRDACLAVRAAKQKCQKTGQFQSVSFKSKRNPSDSIFIPKAAISENGVYHTKLGKLRLSERLPENIKDSRLVKDGTHYYLCVSYSVTIRKRKPNGRVVALDPGVRTFLTYFHEHGFGWLGHHAINRIQRLCSYLDDLLSRASKATKQQAKAKAKKNMRRAANRIRKRIRNLVDELHKKVARWLVDNFDIILLPTFETSQMTCKSGRKLHKRTVRQMLTLSHYRFKQFLRHKAKETGCLVLDVCEAYTSKTVSWTGEIVKNLGGAKVIKDSAGLKMDRDLNGARGIFLRALVDEPWLLSISNLQTV